MTLTAEYVKEQTGYDSALHISKNEQESVPKEVSWLSLIVKVLTGVGAAIVLAFIILYAVIRYKLAKRRKQRLARARRRRSRARMRPEPPSRRSSRHYAQRRRRNEWAS